LAAWRHHPFDEARQGTAPGTDYALLVHAGFRERPTEFMAEEDQVVAEAPFPSWASGQLAAHLAADTGDLATLRRQDDHPFERCPATGDGHRLELAKQVGDTLTVAEAHTPIAGAVHAGSTVKRVHFQPRVIGEGGQARLQRDVARLQ